MSEHATNAELTTRWQGALMNNYGTPRLALAKGAGAKLWDADGKEYLDFVGGIAVNALGHAHPAIVEAVSAQIGALGHVSNLFIAEPPVALAERLLQLFGRDGSVYFCNSGAEANEGAFKIGRLTGRRHMVATTGGFHGRTMGALALTGQPGKQDGFTPLPGDVTHVPYGDVDALRAAVTEDTAFVIIEPIQGENGVVVPPSGYPGYLKAAREITRATGTLLVLDEVQTGIGRTGHWFAYQADDGIEPDVVTLAKGLGGGLPLGATVAFGEAAKLLRPGQHGTTFGGNPVVCAAGLAVLDTIAGEGLLENTKRIGEKLTAGIEDPEGIGSHPLIGHVRGAGLLLGIVLTGPRAPQVQQAAQDAGFLVNAPAPDVVRLMPPLNLTDEEADAFLAALPAVLDAAAADGEARP
ncbi:acetylornithine transaminase [Streptomyces sp. NPDC050095]|uniref:acetylornithine transaminase n=1 Tax=unclassified Streptomyces TaxID=2593676 RepID=UPI00342255D4